MESREIVPGTIVVREGDLGDDFFIIQVFQVVGDWMGAEVVTLESDTITTTVSSKAGPADLVGYEVHSPNYVSCL